jgi:hypothetical protein
MTEDRVVPARVFCGLTVDEVTLTSRSGSSAHACYDCVTLLACTAASDPAPRASPEGVYATNRAAFAAFLRELDFLGGPDNTASTPEPTEAAKPVVEVKCSFCGKQEQKVKRLIAGPGVSICDECIELSLEVLVAALSEPEVVRITDETGFLISFVGSAGSVEQLLEPLGEDETRIMAFRFGLDRGAPRTLGETAEKFELTTQQVREMELRAMAVIRGRAGV